MYFDHNPFPHGTARVAFLNIDLSLATPDYLATLNRFPLFIR
jgi:hypothetical protein